MTPQDGELLFGLLDRAGNGDEEAKDVLIKAMKKFFADYAPEEEKRAN